MYKNQKIVKATGDTESFDFAKLENSLRRSGADDTAIAKIIKEIGKLLYDGITTRELYNKAFQMLRLIDTSTAARYSLKQAIMELGPSGFPFERFIGQLLKQQGFDVLVGQLIMGNCVQHEVDVVATVANIQYLVECKFYNSQEKSATVKVPLYIHSRVNDIIKKRSAMPEFKNINFFGWIFTNTRFTSDAIDYGKCAGLHLVSWDFPRGSSLKDMIDSQSFFPITVLSSLDYHHKQQLFKNNIVICKQIFDNPDCIDNIGLDGEQLRRVLSDVRKLCSD